MTLIFKKIFLGLGVVLVMVLITTIVRCCNLSLGGGVRVLQQPLLQRWGVIWDFLILSMVRGVPILHLYEILLLSSLLLAQVSIFLPDHQLVVVLQERMKVFPTQ